MCAKRFVTWMCCVLAAVAVAGPAWAKVMTIPDFETDPSGPGFAIRALLPGEGLSENIAAPPELTYGATSVPDGTLNCLRMTWMPPGEPGGDYDVDSRAGWRLTFGTDPNLVNHILSLSINPPGGLDPFGNFMGIFSATIDILDINNVSCGAWDFNTDMAGTFMPVNDPGAQGLSSLVNNAMNTVTINLGNGPAPGSATVISNSVTWGAVNVTAPNGIFGPGVGSLGLAQAASIDFYENGRLRGNWQIPGQLGVIGDINFWDHVSITPEPATLALLAAGGIGMLLRRKRNK